MTHKEKFLSVLSVRDLQPNTVNTYTTIFDSFMRYCISLKLIPEDVSREQLIFYVSKINSDSMKCQAIGMLHNFYEFALMQGVKLYNFPYPHKKRELPDYLTPQELKLLFDNVSNIKQRTILKLQYACGLRVHEVCKIKRSDFIKKWDGNNERFVYDLKIIGKGGHYGIIPVPEETINEIFSYWKWLKERHPEYLFKGQFRSSYSTATVQLIIRKTLRSLGIIKRGSSHLLRTSRAVHLLNAGIDIAFIQRLLRHRSIKTTQQYLGFKTDDMRVVFRNADLFLQKEFEINHKQLKQA
jgi:site-specific recombinase XerD